MAVMTEGYFNFCSDHETANHSAFQLKYDICRIILGRSLPFVRSCRFADRMQQFGFALWLAKFTSLSQTNSKKKTNHAFPAFGAGYMCLIRVLIGSLRWLCLLRLAGVIALVLVSVRFSIECRK